MIILMSSAVVCMDSRQMQNTCDIIEQNPHGPKPAAGEDVSRHEKKSTVSPGGRKRCSTHLSIDHCKSALCLWIEASHNKVRSMRVCG